MTRQLGPYFESFSRSAYWLIAGGNRIIDIAVEIFNHNLLIVLSKRIYLCFFGNFYGKLYWSIHILAATKENVWNMKELQLYKVIYIDWKIKSKEKKTL